MQLVVRFVRASPPSLRRQSASAGCAALRERSADARGVGSSSAPSEGRLRLAPHRSFASAAPTDRNGPSHAVGWPDGSFRTVDLRWKATTGRLLDPERTPVGSVGEIDWDLLQATLAYRLETIYDDDSLRSALQMLDRIVDEASVRSDLPPIELFYVHSLLKSWKRLLQGRHRTLLPSQLLGIMDGYRSRAPAFFAPTVATYSILLDGAGYINVPSERIDFSELLLNRLIEESATNPDVEPTIVTYGTVVNNYAQSASQTGATKAQALCDHLQNLSRTTGRDDLQPNSVILSSVAKAWAKVGDPYRAQQILKRMCEGYLDEGNDNVKPSQFVFNAVLSALAKSNKPGAARMARMLLRKMKQLAQTRGLDVKPNFVSYNCVLACYAKGEPTAQDVQEAIELFREMVVAADRDKNDYPTETTYATVTKIVRNSRVPNKAAILQPVFQHMKKRRIETKRSG